MPGKRPGPAAVSRPGNGRVFHQYLSLMWVIVALMFLACGVAYLLLNRIVPGAANVPGKRLKIKEKIPEAPLKA